MLPKKMDPAQEAAYQEIMERNGFGGGLHLPGCLFPGCCLGFCFGLCCCDVDLLCFPHHFRKVLPASVHLELIIPVFVDVRPFSFGRLAGLSSGGASGFGLGVGDALGAGLGLALLLAFFSNPPPKPRLIQSPRLRGGMIVRWSAGVYNRSGENICHVPTW